MTDPLDYNKIVLLLIALTGIYSAWRQRKTEKKVDLVHKAVNSNLEEQLRIGFVAAKTLAETTGEPEHIALADAAKNKYDLHVADQARADNSEGAASQTDQKPI
jgi:hypothetical protein